MPHVTFIHGIANKPEAAELLRIWEAALGNAGNDPLRLKTRGVTTSLIYWADVMYAAPDPDLAAHEGVLEDSVQAVDASGDAAIPEAMSPESAAFIAALRAQLTALPDEDLERDPPASAAARGFERVPLPWFLKKPIMSAFLRDVHHYLFNVEWSPRPGSKYKVQEVIRRRFLDALKSVQTDGPHVVVSHSMGTVIAYDCLKRLPDCAKVDGFITLGSPLGIDEIQDKLTPGWTRPDGFPHEHVATEWINIYDPLDVVCGLDPRLTNDYQRGGADTVTDVQVSNDGAWRHSATKYYRQPAVRNALRRLLAV
jgi:hypothetical protein